MAKDLLLGGIFSGLSLGLMQLDPTRLKIVKQGGNAKQKAQAQNGPVDPNASHQLWGGELVRRQYQ